MGNFPHTLDEKGRVIIPRKYRDEIATKESSTGLVVTMSPENCLFLYTENHWEELNARQEAQNKGSQEFWKFQRWFHANAESLNPDKQGRVLIPERLRTLAKIEREIVFAGCFDRIEVWPRGDWETAQQEAWKAYGDNVGVYLAGGPPGEGDPSAS
ncbi:MAG: division/cell wall cluster transcriptional repressor MraZ [Planctomycetota bacterium]